MFDFAELPARPTPELTSAIRSASEKGDVASLKRLTRCETDVEARYAAVVYLKMQGDGPIAGRMTSRDWLADRGFLHLLPKNLPREAIHAGFTLNGHGGVSKAD